MYLKFSHSAKRIIYDQHKLVQKTFYIHSCAKLSQAMCKGRRFANKLTLFMHILCENIFVHLIYSRYVLHLNALELPNDALLTLMAWRLDIAKDVHPARQIIIGKILHHHQQQVKCGNFLGNFSLLHLFIRMKPKTQGEYSSRVSQCARARDTF